MSQFKSINGIESINAAFYFELRDMNFTESLLTFSDKYLQRTASLIVGLRRINDRVYVSFVTIV